MACSKDVSPADTAEPVGTTAQAVWGDPGFEGDTNGSAPDSASWTVKRFLNDGITVQTPQTYAGLGLATGGDKATIVVGAATPESVADPDAPTLKYPKYGQHSVVVNYDPAHGVDGNDGNANELSQTATMSAGDVDPADGLVHVRFVLAPVLQDPGHDQDKQPYFFVQLTNVTKSNTIIYQDYNFSNQPGVPWLSGSNDTLYTNWALVDVAPGAGQLDIGDQVQLQIVAAGCGFQAHYGRVYVDAFGATIPGIYVWGTAPSSVVTGGTLTYTLNYKNGGASTATASKVDFTTPPGTTFVSTDGPSCTTPAVDATGKVTCTTGDLAAGATGSFHVTVKVKSVNSSGTAVGGTITAGDYDIYASGINPLIGSKIYTTVTANVSVFGGGTQSTNVNTAFGSALDAKVTDFAGAAIQGVTVTYTRPGSGASCTLSNTTRNSNSSGRTSVTATANGTPGAYVVTASVPGGGSTTFDLTNLGPAASISVFDGAPQQTVVGTPFATSLVAIVKDAAGTGLSGKSVTFSAPTGSVPSATLASPTTVTTDASGKATLTTATANTKAGTYDVTAKSGALTTTFALTNLADVAKNVAVSSGSPQTVTVGASFAPLVALVTDQYGNPAPGAQVTFAPPPSGATAEITGSPATSGSDGKASVAAKAGTVAGSYAVTASVPSGTTSASFSLSNGLAPGMCFGDADCTGKWCMISTQTCTAKYANGVSMPNDPPHANPTLNGTCASPAANLVCATSVCDADDACGWKNGTSGCTAGADARCRSNTCSSVGKCMAPGSCLADPDCGTGNWCDLVAGGVCKPKQANGDACTVANGCTSGVCAADQKCGYPEGGGTCGGDPQCRTGLVCVTGGANAGKCEPCNTNTQCGGSTPVCLASTNHCVQCTTGQTSACTATTPLCDVGSSTCVGCNGNSGSGASHACGAGAPYCNTGTGACSTSCFVDADCGSGNWCDAGSCKPKQPNGNACTAANGCTSGVCAADQKCGYPEGGGTCGGDPQCRAGLVCVTGGANAGKCEPCNTNNECAGSTPVCLASTNHCVQCTTGQTSACTGTTPLCDVGSSTCVGCNGNSGSGASHACGAGAPFCNTGTGACSTSCFLDTDCGANTWCNAGSCVPKIDNGNPVANDPGHTPPLDGTCNASTKVECKSSVCDTDDKCGWADGDGPCDTSNAAVVCRSGSCSTSNKCAPANGCLVDDDCASTQYCHTEQKKCVARVPNGDAIPTVAGHDPALNGTCSVDAAKAVCISEVCDLADNECGYANGHGSCDAQNGATVCRSQICDLADGKCGWADGDGPCDESNAATVCRSGLCSASHKCQPTGGCLVDQDCPSYQFCDTEQLLCADKLSNGTLLPTIDGHDPALTGACDADVGKAVCASGVCSADGKCGYPAGDGPCASSTVCRTGLVCITDQASANASKCEPCGSDLDCSSPTPACDLASNQCVACTAANGAGCSGTTPLCDATSHACHECDGNAGSGSAFACPAGAPYCAADGSCSASCQRDTDCGAGNWCNAGTCAAQLPNGETIPTVQGHDPVLDGSCSAAVATAVCATGACDTDGKCGLALHDGVCAGTEQCRDGVCVGSGPNQGKCEVCASDLGCSGATPVCDPATNDCVACTATNIGACGGTTPVCTSGETCAACGGDLGSGSTDACFDSGAPYCAADGSCGKCGKNDDCVGHAGPICNLVSGACGTACSVDADCVAQWCDNPTAGANAGVCSPKVVNGQPVPASAPLNGECTVANGQRVCVSALCEASDDLCGLLNGSACAAAADCRSEVCNADGKCGDPNGEPCTAATTCRSGICDGDGKCGKPDGATCTGADECRSAVCIGGRCGQPMDAGVDADADADADAPDVHEASVDANDAGHEAEPGTQPAASDGIIDGDAVQGGGCSMAGGARGEGSLAALLVGVGLVVARRRREAERAAR